MNLYVKERLDTPQDLTSGAHPSLYAMDLVLTNSQQHRRRPDCDITAGDSTNEFESVESRVLPAAVTSNHCKQTDPLDIEEKLYLGI